RRRCLLSCNSLDCRGSGPIDRPRHHDRDGGPEPPSPAKRNPPGERTRRTVSTLRKMVRGEIASPSVDVRGRGHCGGFGPVSSRPLRPEAGSHEPEGAEFLREIRVRHVVEAVLRERLLFRLLVELKHRLDLGAPELVVETRICHLCVQRADVPRGEGVRGDRKSTRLNSSHVKISYAV